VGGMDGRKCEHKNDGEYPFFLQITGFFTKAIRHMQPFSWVTKFPASLTAKLIKIKYCISPNILFRKMEANG